MSSRVGLAEIVRERCPPRTSRKGLAELLIPALHLVRELPLPRRATSVLLPPRQAPRVRVDGFRDRLGVHCCIPIALLVHDVRVLLRDLGIVRVIVRERCPSPAETSRKEITERADFIGSCRLACVGV
jgi:hypothetical protein